MNLAATIIAAVVFGLAASASDQNHHDQIVLDFGRYGTGVGRGDA